MLHPGVLAQNRLHEAEMLPGTSTPFRPVLHVDPVLLSLAHERSRGVAVGLVHRQRLQGELRVRRERQLSHRVPRRAVHRIRVRGAEHEGRARGATPSSPGASRCRRSGRSATTNAAGTTTAKRTCCALAGNIASARSPVTCSGSTSSTWTATACSPGTTTSFRICRACSAKLEDSQLRVITIVDPGVKFEPGYAVFDQGLAKNAFCKTEAGNLYVGQVWPGRTRVSRFFQGRGARLVG